MRSFLSVTWACLSLLLCLSACGPSTGKDLVSGSLGLDASQAEEIVYTDDHGGWLGDGLTHIVLTFPEGGLLGQLRRDARWNLLPMDGTTQALLSYVNGEELVQIPQGYFRLIDRHSDTQTPILSRYSYNFTLAVYDEQQRTLHYFELDT
ncbi:MAG TPA: hypothetical protein IAC25_01355 [Candidatus Enterenecus stercoripullorum]|nr:hypothetical protein [Candidatus Enterenecus stercoripullorum]